MCIKIHVHQNHTDCLTASLKDHYSTAEIETWMYGRSPRRLWRFATSGETFATLKPSLRVARPQSIGHGHRITGEC